MKTVQYTASQLLACAKCNGDVVICVDSTLVSTSLPWIVGTVVTTLEQWDVCGKTSYVYGFQYDEAQLADPAYSLVTSDINGVFCKGCLTDYIDSFGMPPMAYILSLLAPYFDHICLVTSEAELIAAIANVDCNHIAIGEAFTLTANRTIPAGKVLTHLNGCETTTNGHTFRVNGGYLTGAYAGFVTTAGEVLFGRGTLEHVLPQWFGALGDNAHDDTTAIQAAVDSLEARGGTVFFPEGRYLLSAAINIPSYTNIYGAGMHSSIIYQGGAAGQHILNFVDAATPFQSVNECCVRDVFLLGNASSGDGIRVTTPDVFFATQVRVENCGGRGMAFYKDPLSVGQSIFIEKCDIYSNLAGGVYLGSSDVTDGPNIGHVMACKIGHNGYYGIYLQHGNVFQIKDNEFSGYYWDHMVAGKQAYPICVYSGYSLLFEGNSFENNGGQVSAVAVGCCIRFGFKGDTQTEPNNANTFAVTIKANDFVQAGGNVGDMDFLKLHWIIGCTIEGNFFEKSATATGTVNGIRWATFTNGRFFQANNMMGNPAAPLDAKFVGVYDGQYVFIEEDENYNTYIEVQLDDWTEDALRIYRDDRAGSYPEPTMRIKGRAIWIGYDINAPVQVLTYRQTGWTTVTGVAEKDGSTIDTATITATDGNIQALAKVVKALVDAGLHHGFIGA